MAHEESRHPEQSGASDELVMVGISHHRTPIELRERVALPADIVPELLGRLRSELAVSEVVLVSTCNRLELYAATSAAEEVPARYTGVLEEIRSLPAGALSEHIVRHDGREALEHLCQLACGLDSLVVGETQILGQLKDSYRIAVEQKSAGRITHRAFQTAFRVAKAVHTRVGLGRGHVSVASVAVDLAQQLFESLTDKTVLVVGAGDVAENALQSLRSAGARRFLICNRTEANAAELAERMGGEVLPFSDLVSRIAEADLVLTSVSVQEPILDRPALARAERARRGRSLLVIDLGLPRNVAPKAATLESVFLYNIDDLEQQVARNLESRMSVVNQARSLVREHLEATSGVRETREFALIASTWQSRSEGILAEELEAQTARLRSGALEPEEALARLGRRLVARMSHGLFRALTEASEEGDRLRNALGGDADPEESGGDPGADKDARST